MNSKYLRIQDEVINKLISGKDTSILSRKMGYSFNQVSRWKNHSKKLKWNEFIELCKITKFPIESVLEETLGISMRTKTECKKTFIKMLLSQNIKKRALSLALKKSRPSIYRLQNATTAPDFVSVLALIDVKPLQLNKFTEHIMNKNLSRSHRSPFTVPWLSAVSAAMAQKEHLNLPSFSADWIAKKVKLNINQVKLAVQVMVENELIKWDGNHYFPTLPRTLALNHERNKSDFYNNLKFWTLKSATAMDLLIKNDINSDQFKGVFRTFMATKENVEKINLLILNLEEEIHNIISSTSGEKTEIRSFVFTHFDVCETEVI